ncbi:MAG: hypothetical protein MHM6MM_001566 [Cercozoa sp. M6MM]
MSVTDSALALALGEAFSPQACATGDVRTLSTGNSPERYQTLLGEVETAARAVFREAGNDERRLRLLPILRSVDQRPCNGIRLFEDGVTDDSDQKKEAQPQRRAVPRRDIYFVAYFSGTTQGDNDARKFVEAVKLERERALDNNEDESGVDVSFAVDTRESDSAAVFRLAQYVRFVQGQRPLDEGANTEIQRVLFASVLAVLVLCACVAFFACRMIFRQSRRIERQQRLVAEQPD